MTETEIRDSIASLTDSALCGEWKESDDSILKIMGRNAAYARDVPVATEMIALLQHFAPALEIRHAPELGHDHAPDVHLSPGIVWGDGKFLLLLDVPADTFEYIAHWIADRLPSAQIKAMPGILTLPFTIEPKGDDGRLFLFPDWFSVFYPYGWKDNVFPILGLKSVLMNESFGGDWVKAAIGRMGFYSLPRREAEAQHDPEIAKKFKSIGFF